MPANKTQKTTASVEAFIAAIDGETQRRDAKAIDKLMREVTGEMPAMWGPNIVGYGKYRYVYASGREGDWMLVGFSPRKAALTLYIMPGFSRYEELMAKLGKYKTGKSCLYLKTLADVDPIVLRELVAQSVEHMRSKAPTSG